MRRTAYILILFILLANSGYSASVEGTWQGAILPAGQGFQKGIPVYVDFNDFGSTLSGKMREEKNGSSEFAVVQFNGKRKNELIELRQTLIERKSKSGGMKWCLLSMELTYDSLTGYLRGKFSSSDCKRFVGEVILYRSEFELAVDVENAAGQLWFSKFASDWKEGFSAPEIRKKERDNFVFEPIYFDFDKFEIRPEHYAFLDRMIKVVKGHSDLRVQVIGHTDSKGSDAYNDVLSKQRAKAIVDYFVKRGLSADRLVFDFKGEKEPIDSNETPDGRQRNRRVDFSFI
jgi:outer membrane protein OmpA-like peptidoglycan-associated protein